MVEPPSLSWTLPRTLLGPWSDVGHLAVEGVGEPGGHVHRRRVVRTGEGEPDGAAFVDGGRRREYRGGRHVAYGDRGRPLGRSAIFVGDLPLDHIGALVIECAHRRR